MIKRLAKIIKSLTGQRIDDEEYSLTVDDTVEGKRKTFNKQEVDTLLKEHGLLEESNGDRLESNHPSKSE